jgi:hypothetical protein
VTEADDETTFIVLLARMHCRLQNRVTVKAALAGDLRYEHRLVASRHLEGQKDFPYPLVVLTYRGVVACLFQFFIIYSRYWYSLFLQKWSARWGKPRFDCRTNIRLNLG